MSELVDTTPCAAIIIIGGVRPDVSLAAALESEGALVIAADSGAVHAKAAGLTIDIAVGDFDSIPPMLLQELESAGVKIERHPVVKDATDLELAIDVAIRQGADVITIVGGHGGRVDQSFANAFVISSPTYSHVSMHAILDRLEKTSFQASAARVEELFPRLLVPALVLVLLDVLLRVLVLRRAP